MPDEPPRSDAPTRRSIRARIARLIAGPEPATGEPGLAPGEEGAPPTLPERARAFETATVADVMTSRVDVAAVEIDATLQQVLELFARDAHSRMPVYHDSLDEALGFVHIKDVVAELVRKGWSEETLSSRPLERLKREIMFVAESMRLPDLLLQMQSSRIHIAIVVDEYGGAGGVVCLEDLIEEIVGDIEDEHDATVPAVQRRGRNVWDVDALTSVEDVERKTGLKLAVEAFEDEIDTIGGLASALAGRLPQVGESVEHPSGARFEVIEADPRRIIRLRLRSAPRPSAAPLADSSGGGVDRPRG